MLGEINLTAALGSGGSTSNLYRITFEIGATLSAGNFLGWVQFYSTTSIDTFDKLWWFLRVRDGFKLDTPFTITSRNDPSTVSYKCCLIQAAGDASDRIFRIGIYVGGSISYDNASVSQLTCELV